MAATENKEAELPLSVAFQIDATYELDAPRFFNFIDDETEEEMGAAELWFEKDHTYAPSPFMPKIKKERSIHLESLCDFEDADKMQEEINSSTGVGCNATQNATSESLISGLAEDTMKVIAHSEDQIGPAPTCAAKILEQNNSFSHESSHVMAANELTKDNLSNPQSTVAKEICTPRVHQGPIQGNAKKQTEKKIGSSVQRPSGLKPKNTSQSLGEKELKLVKTKNLPSLSATKGLSSATRSARKAVPNDVAQENQAIKRQKLDGGKTRQILDVKARIFTHKSKLGNIASTNNISTSALKPNREEKKDLSQRKVYVREQVTVNPFISAAEMVQKFHSSTRSINLPCTNKSQDVTHSVLQSRPVLKLTHPKDPELQTSQRIRTVKLKSTAEIEEETLANRPKFKARPLNKKIFEAPKLPPAPRKTPQISEFQEFHFKTMERAAQHAAKMPSSLSTSSEVSCQNPNKVHKLTEPRTPRLETSLRARPTKIKTTEELELEELEKMPKFKAKPLDKKIMEGKGAVGLLCTHKRQLTVPQEFHFATDERLPPVRAVEDLFDKLSLKSEPQRDQTQLQRTTTTNPFHLQTEERGMLKERKLAEELKQRQLEEERARIPKAKPYPYTTDIPVVPPKPAPKECTKPEGFQLESLIRHEEEVQKKMEESERMEREEARMRIFIAAPIMKEDPIPLPERERKPLTEVQEFVLHVVDRAADRAEFDKKIEEKEMMYKRHREEYELNQKIEEEKELKQMRRTMVPHAKPIPNFANPFLPQRSSKETTKPKSPRLRVLHRRRFANSASQMR